MKKYFFVLIAIAILINFSCQKSEKKEDLKVNVSNVDSSLVSSIKDIYYNVPSPFEISNILKSENFDTTIFMSLDSLERYTSEKSMALMLGVYSADISFLILSGNKASLKKYLATINTLIKKLGIEIENLDSINQVLIQDFDDDYLLKQDISNLLYNTDAYLKESGRENLAIYVAFGAWIEANYLLFEMLDNCKDTITLYQLIADQSLVIDNLLNIIDKYKVCEQISHNLVSILKIYEKISIRENVQKYDELTGDTITKVVVKYNFDKFYFDKLKQKFLEIRQLIINMN